MLGNITHIFQVPLRWLKAVDARIFKSAPGNMIEFTELGDGGLSVGVDPEAFAQAVAECGGSGTGTVTSVDGRSPDSAGAVDFGLTASRQVMTDSNGHLTTVASEGQSTTNGLTIVTNVAWDSANHKLTVTKRTLQFENGICTSFGPGTIATTNVDVATLVTWA